MVHYSVLIPHRNAADALGQLLAPLRGAIELLTLPYEIICIDDASCESTTQQLQGLLDGHAPLRVLRFDQPRGTSAALTAGLRSARGEVVVAMAPETAQAGHYLPHLLSRLGRHDMVVAYRQRTAKDQLRQWAARWPRLVAAAREADREEDLFWAARRKAVSGLTLARGSFRVLESIAARNGARVCRLLLSEGLPPERRNYQAGPLDRLARWWLDRRYEPHLGREMVRFDRDQSDMLPARFDAARPRHVPNPVFLSDVPPPGDNETGNPA